jgi:ParB family transcriptional regulator, chromosome partitioning protein
MEEKKVLMLGLDDILPNRFQPRIRFNEVAINELAESIKKHGVIQPIVVRQIGDKYEIIAGERRYKASIIAGQETIPAIVANLDDRNSAEVALIENVQREDLTPIEEAVSYKKILDMGYLTQSELAQKLGKEQSTVANKLRLLNLHEEVQDALLEEEISERHARSLLKLNKDQQKELLKEIVEKRLTVRKTDQEIEKILKTNSQLEVLDFDNEGDNIMNETPEVKIEEPIINEIDPGFTNINKIETEAKDIYEEKPNLDLGMILNKPMEEEKPEENLVPRRFFGFLPNEEEVEKETPTEDIFKNFDFNNNPTKVVLDEPKVEQPDEPIIEQPIETAIEEPKPFSFEFDLSESPTIEEPKIEINPTESTVEEIIEEPIVQSPIEEVEEITQNAEKPIFEPYYEDESIAEIKIEEPTIQLNTKNVRDAINKVRNCAKELETLGFVVDIDEFDLENMYQVIFKINKE